jgi:catechol 2,3-dioxygenase-like lactoylglutathione lyase family enzyme
MNIVGINHVSLWVKDVSKSVDFYCNNLELPLLDSRPRFEFAGAWIALGELQQLHIIEGRDEEVAHSSSRRNHFAIQVVSISKLEQSLIEKGIQYKGPKARPDGILQIFIQDPDGYWIEFTEL